jgi:hypothetical protein
MVAGRGTAREDAGREAEKDSFPPFASRLRPDEGRGSEALPLGTPGAAYGGSSFQGIVVMSSDGADAVSLDDVVCTEVLSQRAGRPPDHEAEARSIRTLLEALAHSPRTILQKLAETAMEVCGGHSAGISLLEQGDAGHLSAKGDTFRWHAVAGRWSPMLWTTTTRRDNGPCGTVLDRNTTLLFSYAHRHFTQFAGVVPLLVEALLVPFHIEREAVGTIWVVMHDESRNFDGEDRRMLESLATFATIAYEILDRSGMSILQAPSSVSATPKG